MSMKLTLLRTFWEADDAYCIISFLDELRDALWETYGTEIKEAQHAMYLKSTQMDLPFDDEIEF